MLKFKHEWEKIALGSLLHDIGKLFNRHSEYRQKGELGGTHPSLSVWYYNQLVNKGIVEKDEIVETVIQRHHEYYSMEDSFLVQKIENKRLKALAMLVSRADNYSSMERDEDEREGEKKGIVYSEVPLDSIFSRVSLEKKSENKNIVEELSAYRLGENLPQNMFPERKIRYTQDELKKIIENFYEDSMKIVGDSFMSVYTQLLTLIEKYTWCLPSDTQHQYADIPLYDHLKTTSAIALANYHFIDETGKFDGTGHGSQSEIQKSAEREDFLLIGGDISGIQNFIFNIGTEKNGAKRLRARSFKVKMLTDIVTYRIIMDLELTPANILMNSGGKFTILAPNTESVVERINKIEKELELELYLKYKGEIYIALSTTPICGNSLAGEKIKFDENGNQIISKEKEDIKKFTDITRELNVKLDKKKKRKFEKLIIELPIFESELYGEGKNSKLCTTCGRELVEDGRDKCLICEKDIELGGQLPETEYLAVRKALKDKNENKGKNTIEFLGVSVELLSQKELKALKDDLWFIVNLKNSELFGYYPQISGSYGGYIPKGKTFEDIAKGATGVKNLGILKADVDNLGLIFSNGFKFNETKVSVSRISNLSKMLDTFFSKFIESSIEHKSLKQGSLGMEIDTSDFYVVYSGGDDLMIVAPWDKLILFSQFLNDKFSEFTRNDYFTLSMGLELAKVGEPFYQCAKSVEEAEKNTKNSGKNGITIFDRYLPWDKFSEVIRLGELIYTNLKNGAISQSFVYRLLKYTEMAEKYLEGEAYYLTFISKYNYDVTRNFKEKDNKKDLEIIKKLNAYFIGIDDNGNFNKEKIEFVAKYMRIAINYAVRKNREGKNV